jgi:hypothetical protein
MASSVLSPKYGMSRVNASCGRERILRAASANLLEVLGHERCEGYRSRFCRRIRGDRLAADVVAEYLREPDRLLA